MPPRVTVRQIARKAGVQFTTVALALKDDPRVRDATRQRVRALAARLGYVPDPLLSALSAYRRAGPLPRFRETLAWVTSHDRPDGWRSRCYSLYHAGASERAAELGYRLQEFWLREKGVTLRRAASILSSQGIRGLLLCPLPEGNAPPALDFRRFAALSFGYSAASLAIDHVASSHYQAGLLIVHRLREQGYRRIGFANPDDLDARTAGLWKASYRSGIEGLPESEAIPLFTGSALDPALFLRWWREHRPQVVVTAHGPIRRWLREAGHSVPREVGLAFLNLQEPGSFTGCIEPSHLLGRTAVDLLSGLLQRGQFGLPAAPRRVLLDGAWNSGKTVASLRRHRKFVCPPGRDG